MDGYAYRKARQLEHYNISVSSEHNKLNNLLQNCRKYQTERQYITKPINEEEAAFPIAYAIVGYKHAFQIERLLRSIYRPQNIYCIHIDIRNSSLEVFQTLKVWLLPLLSYFLS